MLESPFHLLTRKEKKKEKIHMNKIITTKITHTQHLKSQYLHTPPPSPSSLVHLISVCFGKVRNSLGGGLS